MEIDGNSVRGSNWDKWIIAKISKAIDEVSLIHNVVQRESVSKMMMSQTPHNKMTIEYVRWRTVGWLCLSIIGLLGEQYMEWRNIQQDNVCISQNEKNSSEPVFSCTWRKTSLLYLMLSGYPFEELMGTVFDVVFWDRKYSPNDYQRSYVCSHRVCDWIVPDRIMLFVTPRHVIK